MYAMTDTQRIERRGDVLQEEVAVLEVGEHAEVSRHAEGEP